MARIIHPLGKHEFELDARLRKYQKIIDDHESGRQKISESALHLAKTEVELTEPKLRQIQRRIYGWRTVERIYEKDKPSYQGYLQEKILNLEEQESKYQRVISTYKDQVRNLETQIETLAGLEGHEDRIREAKEQLLSLHEQYHIAETGLPMVQAELEELRKELEAVREGTKKAHALSEKQTWESVSAEISGRAMEKVRKYGIEYSLAVSQVLREDPELAHRYVFETD